MKVLILVDTFSCLEENHTMFPNEFLSRGISVTLGIVNSLATVDYRVYCSIVNISAPLVAYEGFETQLSFEEIEHFDIVWVMSQPHPLLAKDGWQILWQLSQRTWFVNSVESLVFLNNKNNLGLLVPPQHLVENHVSNDYQWLWSICQDKPEKQWIVKPTNGACGGDVFLIDRTRTNAQAILQSMTGNVQATYDMIDADLVGLQNKYCVLQGYSESAANGVQRVLFAGGQVIASYGRIPKPGEHRSNYTHGGTLARIEMLTEDELKFCDEVGRKLREFDLNFAGIDMAYPHVLEVNLVNPTALGNVLAATGINQVPRATDAILQAYNVRTGFPPQSGDNRVHDTAL